METSELIASFIAAILTVMVLSYLIGDNPLFKIAMHLLIGVAAGYAGAIAIRNVLIPGLVDPILEPGPGGLLSADFLVGVVVPWILVILLFLKVAPGTARYGTISMALLVGVGAAVVVGGSITGTIVPLTLGSMSPLGVEPTTSQPSGLERFVDVLILLVGTITALLYFQFSIFRQGEEMPLAIVGGVNIPGPVTLIKGLGKGFIALTFGVMYAGAVAATLIILAERMQFLWGTFTGLLNTLG